MTREGETDEAVNWLPVASPHRSVRDLLPPPSSFILSPGSAAAASSYTFAALVLGAGLLAAWAWRAPAPAKAIGPGNFRTRSRSAWQSPQPAAPAEAEVVAKITRLRRVKFGAWEHPAKAPAEPRPTSSPAVYIRWGPGSIEFVYHCSTSSSEGPARYLVESADSGMLLLGKLTATVKTATDGPSAPLFVIQTRNTILELRDADLRLRTDASGETRRRRPRPRHARPAGLRRRRDRRRASQRLGPRRGGGDGRAAGALQSGRTARDVARRLPRRTVYSGTPEPGRTRLANNSCSGAASGFVVGINPPLPKPRGDQLMNGP